MVEEIPKCYSKLPGVGAVSSRRRRRTRATHAARAAVMSFEVQMGRGNQKQGARCQWRHAASCLDLIQTSGEIKPHSTTALLSKANGTQMRQTTPPGGHKDYRFDSSWEGDGQISDAVNKPLWRYKSVGRKSHSSLYGFFRLPVFVVKFGRARIACFHVNQTIPFAVYEVRKATVCWHDSARLSVQ